MGSFKNLLELRDEVDRFASLLNEATQSHENEVKNIKKIGRNRGLWICMILGIAVIALVVYQIFSQGNLSQQTRNLATMVFGIAFGPMLGFGFHMLLSRKLYDFLVPSYRQRIQRIDTQDFSTEPQLEVSWAKLEDLKWKHTEFTRTRDKWENEFKANALEYISKCDYPDLKEYFSEKF